MGHRMSSLPLTQFCGQAPAIREKFSGSADRPAVQSSYFHAVCAGRAEEAARLRPQLTPEQLEDVDGWFKPAPCVLEYPEGKISLDYADATKELEVRIDEDGEWCEDPIKAMSVGHLDFAWTREYGGARVAFIADIKRTKWTVRDPNSLQLLAYGWAYSKFIGADAFVPGIWAAQEGEWAWGDWVSMSELDNLDLWWRIRHAATNTGPASTGPHCRDCFVRLHCPQFVFPEAPEQLRHLSVFSENGPEPDPVNVADAVLWAQSVKDVADRILENAKEYAKRGNEVRAADGRKWSVTMRAGNSYLDRKKLDKEHPGLAEQYMRKGNPYPVATWIGK